MKIQKEKGITLVALVVTIVVLIILATISINIIFGQEGIIERVKQAKQENANAQAEEQEILADTANSMETYITGEREQITVDKEEYEDLKSTVAELQQNQVKKPILIERTWAKSLVPISTSYTWTDLETVSLSGYGTGIATISYSASNGYGTAANSLDIQVNDGGGGLIGSDGEQYNTARVWIRGSTSSTINYNESTTIVFSANCSHATDISYRYSILLQPD